MKKLVSLLLALCLCLSLAPLSLAEDTPAYLSDVSPVTLKMYFDRPVDGNLVAQANGKEPLSVKWKEETGVTIDFAYAVDDDCRLLVRYDDGTEQALSYGEIRITIDQGEER